jgi:hypothetical protein
MAEQRECCDSAAFEQFKQHDVPDRQHHLHCVDHREHTNLIQPCSPAGI